MDKKIKPLSAMSNVELREAIVKRFKKGVGLIGILVLQNELILRNLKEVK